MAPAAVHIPQVRALAHAVRMLAGASPLLLHRPLARLETREVVWTSSHAPLPDLHASFRPCLRAPPTPSIKSPGTTPCLAGAGLPAQGLLRVCPELLGQGGRRVHRRAEVGLLLLALVAAPRLIRCCVYPLPSARPSGQSQGQRAKLNACRGLRSPRMKISPERRNRCRCAPARFLHCAPQQPGVAHQCAFPAVAALPTRSAEMLADLGLNWVILGHSERRHIIGESDEASPTRSPACCRRQSCRGQLRVVNPANGPAC